MALVKNSIVKMDWESDSFILMKNGVFVVAGQDYLSSTRGVNLTVFFNANTAFLWISEPHTEEEDYWNAKELRSWLKENIDGSFPINFEEYVPIVEWGADVCNQNILEEYGLTEYADDILARVKDLADYDKEEDKPVL